MVVEDLKESSYLYEVPSKSSKETPGSTTSVRQYNKRARSYIDSQASEESSEESSRGYYGPCDQKSFISDATVFSGLSEYSGLPVSVVSFPVSELRGKSLGSEDSTRSVDTTSEDLSFLSHLESIHKSPVIRAFVFQNKKHKHNNKPCNYPTLGHIKRTKSWK